MVRHNGEMVIPCINPDPDDINDFPDAPAGTRILREDGRVYTLGEDGFTLIDDNEILICPVDMTPFNNQELFRVLMEITGERNRLGV